MKKIIEMLLLTLLLILPLLSAAAAPALAESYATPLPGEVAAAAEGKGIDLTPVLQAVIALIAALITGQVIPWIRSRTTEKQFANLETAARVAVFAAEQLYGAAEGDSKLDYAVEKLRERGFDLDAELLREAVEAAVYDLNYEKRLDIREEAREARKAAAAPTPEEFPQPAAPEATDAPEEAPQAAAPEASDAPEADSEAPVSEPE